MSTLWDKILHLSSAFCITDISTSPSEFGDRVSTGLLLQALTECCLLVFSKMKFHIIYLNLGLASLGKGEDLKGCSVKKKELKLLILDSAERARQLMVEVTSLLQKKKINSWLWKKSKTFL